MLVGDLIYNDNFDCDCYVKIYDCTDSALHYNTGAKLLYDSTTDNSKPLDAILDMNITHVTIDINTNSIIIEATK